MAIGSDKIDAEIVDWDEFRAYASTLKVSAVPKTFINHGESFVGTEKEESILERVQKNGQ